MKIVQGDITKIVVDAIVNAANKSLLGGGGVDGAIHRAAGRGLYEECQKLDGCEVGDAKITKGYNLPCKYVIHTVGPIWKGGKNSEEKLLRSCYRTCLRIAKENDLKSIAFPIISAGVFRFPKEHALQIAIQECEKSDLETTLVIFDKEMMDIAEGLDEKINTKIHENKEETMTEGKLNNLNFDSVVYLEWSHEGAMGRMGNVMIYYLNGNELKLMSTDAFANKKLYDLALSTIYGAKDFSINDFGGVFSSNGGFGNNFMFGKTYVDNINTNNEYMILDYRNEKYIISCSVPGVYANVAKFLHSIKTINKDDLNAIHKNFCELITSKLPVGNWFFRNKVDDIVLDDLSKRKTYHILYALYGFHYTLQIKNNVPILIVDWWNNCAVRKLILHAYEITAKGIKACKDI